MRPGEQQFCYQAGPPRLMRCAFACPVVTVEILIELDQIAKVRIVTHQLVVFLEGTVALFIAKEEAAQTMRYLSRNLIDSKVFSRSGGAFDLKIIAVIVMKLLQRFDDEEIHWHPY